MKAKTPQSTPTVVIVDDDASVRTALVRLLESMGAQAETFASPDEYLAHGQSVDADCLLFDVQLPGMTGFELHEVVTEEGCSTPVIFITAHPDETGRDRARAADAVAFLEKPFDDGCLLDAIREALDRESPDDR